MPVLSIGICKRKKKSNKVFRRINRRLCLVLRYTNCLHNCAYISFEQDGKRPNDTTYMSDCFTQYWMVSFVKY